MKFIENDWDLAFVVRQSAKAMAENVVIDFIMGAIIRYIFLRCFRVGWIHRPEIRRGCLGVLRSFVSDMGAD